MPITFAPARAQPPVAGGASDCARRVVAARLAETLERARTIVDVPRWVPSAAGQLLNEVGEYVDFVIAEMRS
ncbi:MAG TPA: hypothetical protein VGA66_02875, partial [Mycobacterium sp.]